jgi:hypothetical protein
MADEPIYCVTATGGILVYPGACPVCREPHRHMADRGPECWECRPRRADEAKATALPAWVVDHTDRQAAREWEQTLARVACEASAAALRRDRDATGRREEP